MGGAAWAVYGLGSKLLMKLGKLCVVDEVTEQVLGLSRAGNGVATLGAIVVAMAVYGALVVALRGISRDDLSLMPKGDSIARLLRL